MLVYFSALQDNQAFPTAPKMRNFSYTHFQQKVITSNLEFESFKLKIKVQRRGGTEQAYLSKIQNGTNLLLQYHVVLPL